ncbi:protein GRINL1A [Pantherophis guttatus]|uniref:DNA-directed RNA polymerase II subunit GRINL1A n=1 Tax=Pantherophis guttatus TaxID=94885 RepID=A0A6P9B6N7_PANGU|nr:protein GRINL1A [Pantherophis guttatus]
MAKPEPNPLSGRSLPELREMLLRQERLLGDRAVVSRLPDGGERVRECVSRLRAAAAVAAEEERRRRSGGAPEAAPPAGLAGALAGLSLGAAAGGLRGAGVRPGGAPRKEKRRPEDASAARLPPLRHAPARMLPLAESVAIQVQQEEARQEMQAKVAAQKLSERLGIKTVHYESERQMMTDYREVRDEEGDSSAED